MQSIFAIGSFLENDLEIDAMWTIGRTSHHDWTLSEGKIHLNLTVVELIELLVRLGCMVDAITYRECQETIRALDRIAPRAIRGDLILVDPDDPDQFIIQICGPTSDTDRDRKLQYRIRRQDADDIMLALERAVDREAGDECDDYDCEDAELNVARRFRFVFIQDFLRIRRDID